MDRPIRRLFMFFTLLFVALLLMLTYVQVWAAPKLKTNASNTRSIEEEMKVDRGRIYSADGVELAVSEKEKDSQHFVRTYPQGDLLAPWLGLQQPAVRQGRRGAHLQRGAVGAVGSARHHQLLGRADGQDSRRRRPRS